MTLVSRDMPSAQPASAAKPSKMISAAATRVGAARLAKLSPKFRIVCGIHPLQCYIGFVPVR
jgi:hypothetical protein